MILALLFFTFSQTVVLKAPNLFLLVLIASSCKYSEQHKDTPIVTTPDYQKGLTLLSHQNDSAFYYFNKTAASSKDSLQIAMAYSHMAAIQSDEGDYYGSQESLLTSLKYLDEQKPKDRYCLTSDYNELGSNSLNLKNYDAAIVYYDRTISLISNPDSRTIALNNKAVAYQKKQQYDQAITIYHSILDKSKKNKKEYARILSNLARTRWLKDPTFHAAPDLLLALQIRKEEKDDWGLNASYSHLSDYYTHSHPDSAWEYASKMYTVACQLNSPDDELEALQKLIVLSPPKDLKQYFTQYQRLSDSIQTARNTAKNQFALIRYEAEKNKADNLKLKQDNTEKKVEIIQQQIIIYSTILIFMAAIIVVVAFYRKRKREHQLKISQKVHDVVANGLYRIMTRIEHRENAGIEQLLDEIEVLYERSRDISYEQPENMPQDFQATTAELLTSFAGPTTKVLVIGNHKDLWDNTHERIKMALKPILLELMINMKKHSGARNVIVRFEQDGKYLKIQYTDDGIGLTPNRPFGNGLTNTGNRIRNIGGRIIFDKNTLNGSKIQIYLPNE